MNLKCRRGGRCAASEAENLITLRRACTDRYITRVTPAEDLSCLNGVAGRGYVFASCARYASYGRYLCRDDKFNRRLEMRLEIRETRFLAHTAFFPPVSGNIRTPRFCFATRPSCLVRVHRHASISLPPPPSSRCSQFIFSRNTSHKIFSGIYD